MVRVAIMFFLLQLIGMTIFAQTNRHIKVSLEDFTSKNHKFISDDEIVKFTKDPKEFDRFVSYFNIEKITNEKLYEIDSSGVYMIDLNNDQRIDVIHQSLFGTPLCEVFLATKKGYKLIFSDGYFFKQIIFKDKVCDKLYLEVVPYVLPIHEEIAYQHKRTKFTPILSRFNVDCVNKPSTYLDQAIPFEMKADINILNLNQYLSKDSCSVLMYNLMDENSANELASFRKGTAGLIWAQEINKDGSISYFVEVAFSPSNMIDCYINYRSGRDKYPQSVIGWISGDNIKK